MDWITVCSNLTLSSTALLSSYQLFKDHRAASLGLFLLGVSAGLWLLSTLCPHLTGPQNEVERAAELLAPALVSFEFLWMSGDCSTAHVLLCGSCLFLGLWDWLSVDAVTVMSHCLALSSLTCGLTVCLFTSNGFGALGSLALGLSPLISTAADEGLLKLLSKGSLSIGCLASTWGLKSFLLELKTWHESERSV